ncbi:Alpha/Beta hydrolase protein [Corynascus novoguineensis]|uniref:Carboxylic ester hydrolase n=1 Tax=Corynascus novoguineensis TaxID=1126955 RepID=A0AAN7CZ02_9PEZI|nr:Alpha/Beta hydrolase protein [Corynascus novoguineensis]
MQFVGLTLALIGLAVGESLKKLDTSLTILTKNDLRGASSPDAGTAVIITDARPFHDVLNVCSKLGEQLWRPGKGSGKDKERETSVLPFAEYLKYDGTADASSKFWVRGSGPAAVDIAGRLQTVNPAGHSRFAGLCTNTAPFSNQSAQDTSSRWQISLNVNNQTIIGFRDRLSFRFLGIRYAPQPQRFTYPTLFKGSGEAASALSYGSQCVQSGGGSEDCLFLNIWTPYLPNPNSPPQKKKLRPVGVWIHGGAFTGGTAHDPTFDGANIVSRGDMVLVAINYRLLAFGFLALKDGKSNGNYGLADQITALDWVRNNIHHFGGDKDRITVFGQSAGAGSVRALIASPQAAGKFSSAIMLSNLGGINYGTTYSQYYTIDEEFDVAAKPILAATNCTAAASQADCLRAIPASTLASFGDARYLVVDGIYLTSPSLPVTGPRLPIKLMMGITRDDGAPFISFPTATNETAYLDSVGLPLPSAKLFPINPTGNATLDLYTTASRIATDGIFRCIDQATASSLLSHGRLDRIYYYEFDRTYQTQGWPGTDVCEPPRTASHPAGDPSKPYLRCHSGELYYVFGNLHRQGLPMRDEGDLAFEQSVLDSFAAFIRTGDPNPSEAWAKARGHQPQQRERKEDRWEPSTKKGGLKLRLLDWPTSRMSEFRERKQCESLGLGPGFYEKE